MSPWQDFRQFFKSPLPPVYHGTAIRVFHWLAVILLVGSFAFAYLDRLFPDDRDSTISAHRQIGIAILLLTVTRFLWRTQYRMPPITKPVPRLIQGVANATQSLLYVLLVAIPLLGWLYTNARGRDVVLLQAVELPRLMPADRLFANIVQNWHEQLATILALLIVLHVVGALYHHFFRRDGLLLAMLPARRFSRFELDEACVVEISGGALKVECRLVNLSAGGAKLIGANGLAPGQRGILTLRGLDYSPRFLLIAAEKNHVRLGFTLEGPEQERMETALADFVASSPTIRRMVPAERTCRR